MRTLCIYALHEYNFNVDFFIKNGLFSDPSIDFYFVINNPDLKLKIPGVTVVNRKNDNLDHGGWCHILFLRDGKKYLYEKYDKFVFLNSTIRGPFLPVWLQDKNWVKLFTDKLNNDVKLFGPMICFFDQKVHVQSMCFTTDKIGLQVGIEKGIFLPDQPPLSKFDICMMKEIGFSTAILEAGYNIGCMLKAFDGVDFRLYSTNKDKEKINTLCFFEPNSYFGTNIHPYEIIFCKIFGDDKQSGHNKELVDKYTNWQESPQKLEYDHFDWVYYVLKHNDLRLNGIKNKTFATAHYNKHGIEEKRSVNTRHEYIKYFKIDLNPLGTSGLLNQFWSLVNGILIGNYTQRHILVENFYPNYNSPETIPIKSIIDINKLNCLIVKLGLRTHVTTKLDGVEWRKSNYFNPTKTLFGQYDFIDTLHFLGAEHEKYVDIGDVFCDSMFKRNLDTNIQNLFVKLISGLQFTYQIKDIVTYIKKNNKMESGYKSIHLRLENDILEHRPFKKIDIKEYGDSLCMKYKDAISENVNPSDKIFVATHLMKSPNDYNFLVDELKSKYPKMVLSTNWRKKFPKFPQGRDVDALIDYILCMESSSFIGYGYSTFSQAIKFKFDESNTKVIMIY